MTGRERVLAAIDHRETDRVPLDMWAEEVVWDRLRKDLRLPSKRAVLERFHIDIRWLDGVYTGPDFSDPDGTFSENMWGERYRIVGSGERVACGGALDHAQSFQEIEAHHWPSNDWIQMEVLRDQIQRDEEYAILYGYADIWQRVAMVRGLDNMFLDMLERPEWVHFMTGKLMDFYREDWTRAMEAAEGRIDIFFLISDLGTQSGPMMNLDLFREFILPRVRIMAELAHSFGKKIMFHSCGSARLYINDLIDAGIDILNPIQPACEGMDPKGLKADFGSRLCFHGGVDIQGALRNGTPGDVRKLTGELIDCMKSNGGFILCPCHTLLPDIPTENITALYDQAYSIRF